MNGTAEQVLKHTLVCSFVASQPFAAYVDAYPALQNKWLMQETDNLQYGQNSEAVRILQYKLNQLSYYQDPIDGDFDILTEHALKQFQQDYTIDVNGQANPRTVRAIIQAEKKKMLHKIEKLSESINIHQHDENVKTVQEILIYFGYYEGEIDGIYGPLTEKALQTAEEKHDMELIENINRENLVDLYEAEEEIYEEKIEVETDEKVNEEVNETEEVTEEVNEKSESAPVEATDEENTEKNDDDDSDKSDEDNDSENSNNREEKQEVKTVEVETLDQSDMIETAHSFIGVPYVWGGDSPDGFDCSGFINYIYSLHDVTIPRTVSEIWNFSQPVDNPSVGDLVFFETYQAGPSHMGIYVGNNEFIHAGESRGVEVTELNNPYWQDKYLGAKRINE